MLTELGPAALALVMLAGIALDWLLGEPRRLHPLVGFGNAASTLDRVFNRECKREEYKRVGGIAAWSLAVLPPVALALIGIEAIRQMSLLAAAALHAVLLYFALGLRSLGDHMLPIASALESKDIAQARLLASRVVSRDTSESGETELAKAAVESLLENGNDAVFGTLFWFAVAGGPGALLFRLANTLDAMWGYRTPRYRAFGWAAARIDDVLNLIPARMTALSYTLLGDTRLSWHCWRTQARAWSSPNAGPVMASGAGALGLALGGPASYGGMMEQRPPLGLGRAAMAGDIARAWRLVCRATMLWAATACVVALLSWAGN
jgi:adenosylcobinamide-phosphate synthase